MSKMFTVVIDQFDNQAMEDDPNGEVARMLREAAERIEQGEASSGVLRDYNGNAVGCWGYRDLDHVVRARLMEEEEERPEVPADFPVRPIAADDPTAGDIATCGECGRSWDDAVATAYTPAPSGRCPFELYH